MSVAQRLALSQMAESFRTRAGFVEGKYGKTTWMQATTFVSRPYRLTTQPTRKTRPGRGWLHEIVRRFYEHIH